MVRQVLVYIYFDNKRWAVVEYGLVIYLPHLTFVLGNLRHLVAVANSICLLFKKKYHVLFDCAASELHEGNK